MDSQVVNSEKRVLINARIRSIIMITALFSMIAIGIAALYMMYKIRSRSETYFKSNLENGVMDSLSDEAVYVENVLNQYLNHVKESVVYVEGLYKSPSNYLQRSTKEHFHVTSKEYCYHRYYVDESYKEDDLKKEIGLLNNIESFWMPILENDSGNITSMYIGTESGFFISYDTTHIEDETNDTGEAYFNHLSRPWYIKAKNENKAVYTDIDEDYFGRGLMITCAAPYYNDGKMAGVIGLDILVNDIQYNIIATDVGEDGYTFAIDKVGKIVASPNRDLTLHENDSIKDENNILYSVHDKILAGKPGIEKINGYYYVYSPIQNIEWMLCAKMSESIITQSIGNFDRSIRQTMRNFVLIACIILFFVFFISNSFSNKITGPIQLLTQDVKIISGGNLDYKAKVVGNDEISDLANSFNTMTSSLKNYINDLTSLTAEREKSSAELNVATHIQAAMLPSNFPAFPEDKRFNIYATMDPAKEVGGDFYDFFKVDDHHLVVVIADVSGKGVPAALFMAIGKTLIKDHSNMQPSLPAVFYTVNNILCESNSENLFITAFEGLIDLDTGLMTYVNAGHELPYIYKKSEGGGWVANKMKPGFVLAGMENVKYSVGTIQLEPGDKLFEYTDGVTEATNSKNELYGMDRLKKALDANCDKSMMELLPAVKADIDKFVGNAPQFDDITMLGFHFKPNG